MKHVFTFVHSNKGKLTKLIKQLFKSIKSLYFYLLGSKTANHVNFMLPMLILCSCYFSSLEGDIRKVSKILASGNYIELVFIPYQPPGQFEPVFR